MQLTSKILDFPVLTILNQLWPYIKLQRKTHRKNKIMEQKGWKVKKFSAITCPKSGANINSAREPGIRYNIIAEWAKVHVKVIRTRHHPNSICSVPFCQLRISFICRQPLESFEHKMKSDPRHLWLLPNFAIVISNLWFWKSVNAKQDHRITSRFLI